VKSKVGSTPSNKKNNQSCLPLGKNFGEQQRVD
jgi:hypothetical protein